MDDKSVIFGFILGYAVAFLMQAIDEISEYCKDKNKQRKLQKKEGD